MQPLRPQAEHGVRDVMEDDENTRRAWGKRVGHDVKDGIDFFVGKLVEHVNLIACGTSRVGQDSVSNRTTGYGSAIECNRVNC